MIQRQQTQYNCLWIVNTDHSFGGTSEWRERIARLVNEPEPRFLLTSLNKPGLDIRSIINSFFLDISENFQFRIEKDFLGDRVSPGTTPSTTLGEGYGVEGKSTNREGSSTLYEMSKSNETSGWYSDDEEQACAEWRACWSTNVQWLRRLCFGCRQLWKFMARMLEKGQECTVYPSTEELWKHTEVRHRDKILAYPGELQQFRETLEEDSVVKRPSKDESFPRKHAQIDGATEAERSVSKQPLNAPQPSRSLSGLQALSLRPNEDITMEDEEITTDQPRKRAAVGDGISAGSASPFREASDSPPPRRSLARPTSGPTSTSDTETRRQATKGQLWTPDQDSPFTRSSFDPSNITSIQTSKSRAQGFKPANRRPTKTSPPQTTPRSAPQTIQQHHHHHHHAPANAPSAILSNRTTSETESRSQNVPYSIILQLEARPISQEELVAEVKGIYASLVIVEAKCIEVDNKQATLAQSNPSTQPKLNNEQ
ncbi:hypothetical protein SBOR_8815 [Sclerotinia borealis F-4128]|uniref:Uncharacterized protein n=1 Tax=Sclerotinia borealis (strain F-4128) TaxID=1432307 RepID=W9C8F1_SCLBF|nr:hypothetical protein SBOR_8815 [Sclerotinia borealis F-4128]